MMVMNDSGREGFNATFCWRVADLRHDEETTDLKFGDIWIVVHKDPVRGVTDTLK